MRFTTPVVVLVALAALTLPATAGAVTKNTIKRPGLKFAVAGKGDRSTITVPGTDPRIIDRIKQSMPAPAGADASPDSVSSATSTPDLTPEVPEWAPDAQDARKLSDFVPTVQGMTPMSEEALAGLPAVERNALTNRHSCCFGSPAPIYLGEVTAQNRNSFGRCVFEAATDTPRAKYGNFRDITFGMTIDCPFPWLQGTGQARLMDAKGGPTNAFGYHLDWAPQFWFDGNMGYGYKGFHRTSDTQTQFIAGWFDITVDDTSASAGFSSAAGSNEGLTCEGLLAKRLRCWFYTQPFAFVPDVVDPTQCREGICATVNALVADAQRAAQELQGLVWIAGSPGANTRWFVGPDDCPATDPTCQFVVDTSNPTDDPLGKASGGPMAVPIGGTTVKLLSETPITDNRTSIVAVTPTIKRITVIDDHICSNGGCGLWEFQLNSRAYCDGKYAWGTRSRYGYAGFVDSNGTRAAGYSQEVKTGFSGDPSRRDLYAYNDGKLSVAFRGSPFSFSKWLHRHYTGTCRSWLVAGT